MLGRLEVDDETCRAGKVFEIEVAGGVKVDETGDDGNVGESTAEVFAAGVGDESGDKRSLRRNGPDDAAFEAIIGSFEINNRKGDFRLGRHVAGSCEDFGSVAADELGLAADDGLRGVDGEPIPLVNMFAEGEEFDAGDGLLIVLSQDAVGRGTIAAALRREEFYEDGYGKH